jgi:hypothetical protein
MNDEVRQRAALNSEHRTLENLVVLYLTQAMLGLVSTNLQAVAVEVRTDRLVVHFAFREDRPDDGEDLEDILADLDALLDNEDLPDDWTIESVSYIGSADATWPGHAFRRVYEVKPE